MFSVQSEITDFFLTIYMFIGNTEETRISELGNSELSVITNIFLFPGKFRHISMGNNSLITNSCLANHLLQRTQFFFPLVIKNR
jgi:hypothetical protein